MTTILRGGLALLSLAVLAGCVTPEESTPAPEPTRGHIMLTAGELAWQVGPSSLPSGARYVILAGDPTSAGPFTMRLEVPAGYVIPPHTHIGREHVTVLSGTGFVSMGGTLERDAATQMPAGSYFEMPAGAEHWFFAGDEPVILQLHGEGPWGITYVNAADDPRDVAGGT